MGGHKAAHFISARKAQKNLINPKSEAPSVTSAMTTAPFRNF
jgi:hypothetical protein